MSASTPPVRPLRHLAGVVAALLLLVGVASCAAPSVDRRDAFAPVAGLPPIQAVALGGGTPVALARDGAVYAWGADDRGQAGDSGDDECGNAMNPRPCRRTPAVIPLPGPATAIAAADDHGLATTADGTVWTWGADHTPAPGRGPGRVCAGSRCLTGPVPVAGLPPVAAISAGRGTDAALDGSGRVWTWGSTIGGRDRCTGGVGPSPGVFACSTRPHLVAGLPPVTAVSAAAQGRVTVLAADGTLWWWGTGYPGPYPTGTPAFAAPRRVEVPVRVTRLVAVGGTTAGVGADGSVWVWGRVNAYDDARCAAPDRCVTTPSPTLPAGSVADLVPGGSLRVRTTDGGELSYGPIPSSGYGPARPGDPPVPTDPPMVRGWFLEPPAPGVTAVSSGDDGALVGLGAVVLRLTDTGTVQARGDNSEGQLAG